LEKRLYNSNSKEKNNLSPFTWYYLCPTDLPVVEKEGNWRKKWREDTSSREVIIYATMLLLPSTQRRSDLPLCAS